MHYQLLVTCNKDHAKTSEEAREFVKSELENDPSFVGGGRFNSPIADWFVIGGRWSGDLSRSCMKIDYDKEAHSRIHKNCKKCFAGLTGQEIEDNKETLQTLWETMGGKGTYIYARDSYEFNGYEDDAMIVNSKLYDKFLKEKEGNDPYNQEQLDWTDLDGDMVDKEFIGNKWLVVVDYHI